MIRLSFLDSSDTRVAAFWDQSADQIIGAIEPALKLAMADLQNYIQNYKLSGQVLNTHKQGAGLKGSLNVTLEKNGDISIAGYVGTSLIYAKIHEYGFNGREFVPNHYRMQTMAWGKPISPREVYVKNHYRDMIMPERSYMRTSLAEKQQAIIDRIQAAVNQTVGQLNGATA